LCVVVARDKAHSENLQSARRLGIASLVFSLIHAVVVVTVLIIIFVLIDVCMYVMYFAIQTCTIILVTDSNMAGQPGGTLTVAHFYN